MNEDIVMMIVLGLVIAGAVIRALLAVKDGGAEDDHQGT